MWTGHIISFSKTEDFIEGNFKKGYYYKYENPFAEEDFINNCIDDEDYNNLQIDTTIDNNIISVICNYEIDQTYSVARTTIYARLLF